ncbi:MAG: restriction endonuclease subunit S [Nitrospira sp.]|nr:restriction endonuclease subunit S [Nitrospira sp.]
MDYSQCPEFKLADLCDSITYGYTESASTIPIGPKFLRITDIVKGHINWHEVPFCNVDEQTKTKYKLRDGDVVIARTGASTGVSAYISNPPEAIFASYLIRLKISAKADARFIYYFLKSHEYQSYMQGVIGDKSAQPNASAKTLTQAKLRLPPLSEQKAVASILGALDDKIELNRKMNETLESMARAIFKSWFVDFDPIPGLGPHKEWQESQVGKIPKGWRLKTVADIAELHRAIVNPGDFPDEFFEYFSIPAFDEGKMPARDLGVTIKSNKFLLPENCVLISKLNPRIPRVWFPKISKLRAIASTEFLVLVPKQPYTKEFIYSLCISTYFLDTFTSLVTGTSSSHQRVKPEDLLSIKIVCPTDLVLDEFTQKVQPLFMTIQSNNNQTHTLAVIRDTLLPKLLSEEIRVKDAEKFVEKTL